jgi:uncharacterized membrane protein
MQQQPEALLTMANKGALRSAERARQNPTYWHWGLVAVLALVFVVYYGALAVRKHDALVTGIDLANVGQTVWLTLNGHPFQMTTAGNMTSRLGMHFEPILLALLPLYALVPSVKTLLWVQAIVLALVVIPLYLLASRTLGRPMLALTFPLLYLLSPAVQNAALMDFHAVALGVLPAMAAFLAVWQGETRTALLFGGVALLAREDYGLWLAALAVIGWWQTRQRIWIVAALAAVAWFVLVTVVLAPQFVIHQSSPFWERYRFWLEGPDAWRAQGFLPEKGRYVVMLLLMGGAGALLAPLCLLPALPALGLNLLSNYLLPVSLDSYYSVLILPTLLGASAIGLGKLRPRWQTAVLLFLLVTALWVHLTEGRSPLVPGFQPPEPTAHSEALERVVADLPEDARLSASYSLAPHFTQRELLRIAPGRRNADYVLLDVLQDHSQHPAQLRQRVQKLLNGSWGVRAADDGFLLLQSGEPNTRIPESFYTFVEPEHAPQYPAQIVFGDAWELQGYDIFWDYWGRPAARLYWRALEPIDADWQAAALAQNAAGEAVSTPDIHPPVTLLWYATSFWQPGETYVVEMLPFEAPDQVTLLVGVGAPLADPGTRLYTAGGRDLVPIATLERQNRGWLVYPEE